MKHFTWLLALPLLLLVACDEKTTETIKEDEVIVDEELAGETNEPMVGDERMPEYLVLVGEISASGLPLLDEDDETVVSVGEETLVVDRLGEPIDLPTSGLYEAYINTAKPTIKIFPAQYTADVLVVGDTNGFVQLHRFEDVPLNENEDVIFVDTFGQTVEAADAANRMVLTFSTEALNGDGTTLTKMILLPTAQ